jgi:hypothetical protein
VNARGPEIGAATFGQLVAFAFTPAGPKPAGVHFGQAKGFFGMIARALIQKLHCHFGGAFDPAGAVTSRTMIFGHGAGGGDPKTLPTIRTTNPIRHRASPPLLRRPAGDKADEYQGADGEGAGG